MTDRPRYWLQAPLPGRPFLPSVTPRILVPNAILKPPDLGPLVAVPLTQENWRSHGPYLFGVDLFNEGFWWEAHESWELPWRLSGTTLQGPFLRGLIQLAASLLKWRLGAVKGQRSLQSKGTINLDAVTRASGTRFYMGLQPSGLAEAVGEFLCGRAAARSPMIAVDRVAVAPKINLYFDP